MNGKETVRKSAKQKPSPIKTLEGITKEMAPNAKVAQLAKIVYDLRKKVTNIEEQVRPSTPTKVMEKSRDTTIEAAKRIEEAKEICAKAVNQVSQTLEALMDDEKLQNIANAMTMFEANITQISNDMK